MRFSRGFLILGHIGLAPVRVHWSFPLGAAVLTRFELRPWMWLTLALLILVHERGHAYLVGRYRLTVTSIEVHAFGGECRYQGAPTAYQTAVIAWGGVLAQALLLPIGFALSAFGPASVAGVAYGLSWMNLWMIGFNLMPIPPLDGSEAWKLIPMLKRRHSARQERKAARRDADAKERRMAEVQREVEAELLRLVELDRKTDHDSENIELPESVQEQLRAAVARATEEPVDKPDDDSA